MTRSNLLEYLGFGEWLNTVLPGFVLSFALFTPLIYAVLGRRLGMQRPAVAGRLPASGGPPIVARRYDPAVERRHACAYTFHEFAVFWAPSQSACTRC